MKVGIMLACLGALVGCGGSGSVGQTTGGPLLEATEEAPAPSGPVSASGATEAHARVGPAGGTLSLRNGARLTIPAGALAEATEVSLHIGADGQAFGDRERQRPLGPMLAVEPAIASEGGAPFELSVPEQPIPSGFEASDLAFAIESVDEGARAIDTLATQTRWQFYPVAVEGGRFVVRISGLAGHRVQFGIAR